MRIKRNTRRKTKRRKRMKSCRHISRRRMSGGGDPLDPVGWAHNGDGEIAKGNPTSNGGVAYFKHSQELVTGDVWRMRVKVGGAMVIGFATKQYNVEKDQYTWYDTAIVGLGNGVASVNSGISLDGNRHYHPNHLGPHIPEAPFDLAMRCEDNVPQIQFNDDSVWRDFAPDGAALSAGPWFPHLVMEVGELLTDHRIDRPRPTKSAGKTKTSAKTSAGPSAKTSAGPRAKRRSKSVGAPRQAPPSRAKSQKIATTSR